MTPIVRKIKDIPCTNAPACKNTTPDDWDETKDYEEAVAIECDECNRRRQAALRQRPITNTHR